MGVRSAATATRLRAVNPAGGEKTGRDCRLNHLASRAVPALTASCTRNDRCGEHSPQKQEKLVY